MISKPTTIKTICPYCNNLMDWVTNVKTGRYLSGRRIRCTKCKKKFGASANRQRK